MRDRAPMLRSARLRTILAAAFTSTAVAGGAVIACSGPSGSAAAPIAPAPVEGGTAALPADAAADADADGPTERDRLEALVDALGRTANAAEQASLVTAFARSVAYGGRGFPIRGRGEVAFVYWDADHRGGPVAVAGDFNAWSTTATPMVRPVAAAPLYVAIVPDPSPSRRSLYKLVRDGSQFFADPWARSFGYDDHGEYALLEPGAEDGHLERWRDFDEGRGSLEPRTLIVWLPPGYDPGATPGYPVVVAQDGQNLFDPSAPHGGLRAHVAANDGVKSGALRPFVLAAVPSSTRRFDEYTHTTDTIPGVGAVGGQADAYTSFVADGVLPFVRARYRVRPEASETAIMGASLGGLVSLYAAQRRPDVFGHAASLSGTTSWGSIGQTNPTIRDRYAQSPPTGLGLYLDSGGDDGGGCATLSALDSELYHDQYCETRALRDALLGMGFRLGSSLVYVWAPGATHDEAAWAARLPNAFATWFPRNGGK